MKNMKRILALIGSIILVGLYISTLVFAILGSPDTMGWFKASVYSTIVIPVLIWAYTLIYRLLKDHNTKQHDDSAKEDSDSSVN